MLWQFLRQFENRTGGMKREDCKPLIKAAGYEDLGCVFEERGSFVVLATPFAGRLVSWSNDGMSSSLLIFEIFYADLASCHRRC